MEEVKEFIIQIKDKGELKTIERKETIEELRERIKCYKRNNIKVMYVVERVVSVSYIEIQI